MPRANKGGMRQGAVGQSYGNRSDLNSSMPVETATNQAYGAASEQRAAQQAIPVAAQPIAGASSGPMPQSAGPTQPTAPMMADQMTSLPQVNPGFMDLMAPTERPDEPVTHGAPLGPGGGPEVLGGPPLVSLAGQLNIMANMPNASPELMDLAHAAQVLGY